MTEPSESLVPGEELLFVPLGGAGEIGMNLSLYGTRGQWVMVDLGITFGDDTTPGIEIIMPDPRFIAAQRERLAGLVLTHAHEDHIGAVPYLWPRLRCPIYATPFTAELLRGKLFESGIEAAITEVPLSGVFDVGPFRVELVTLTHSIPERTQRNIYSSIVMAHKELAWLPHIKDSGLRPVNILPVGHSGVATPNIGGDHAGNVDRVLGSPELRRIA